MKEPPQGKGIPARGKPAGHFCWQRNEIYDIVQQIVGPTAIAVYGNPTRRTYGYEPNFKCTVRELATTMGLSRATVNRELKVLQHVGVVRLKVGRGSRATEFELTDLQDLGRAWGATYNPRRNVFELPKGAGERLSNEVNQLRRSLQGKAEKLPVGDSSSEGLAETRERDTTVSPERHQRLCGETPKGPQLFNENRTRENTLSPTPLQHQELRKTGTVFDQTTDQAALKVARDLFTGVMNDLKDHLFKASRARIPHLDDGHLDWQFFGFDSIRVVEVREYGGALRLALTASDTLAEIGLEKYRKTWDSCLLRWFEREVHIDWKFRSRLRVESVSGC
jgi:hypothetical protein